RFLLLTQGIDDAGGLGGVRGEDVGSLEELGLHRAGRLGQQELAGLEVRERRDLRGGQGAPVEDTALDDQRGVRLGKVTQTLGCLDRVPGDEGDGRRALQVGVESLDTGLLGRDGGQRVLHHGVGCVAAERPTQLLELRDGEPAVLGQHGSVRVAELLRDLGDCGCLVRPRHGNPSGGGTTGVRPGTRKSPAQARGSQSHARRGRADVVDSLPALASTSWWDFGPSRPADGVCGQRRTTGGLGYTPIVRDDGAWSKPRPPCTRAQSTNGPKHTRGTGSGSSAIARASAVPGIAPSRSSAWSAGITRAATSSRSGATLATTARAPRRSRTLVSPSASPPIRGVDSPTSHAESTTTTPRRSVPSSSWAKSGPSASRSEENSGLSVSC